ncbi:sigma-70 family RNA polymerase sigma factor [Paenibacillus sp. JCM 10914]|uniref:sigma-70 family RNA polymerase sigma factor n=1 Tax=Paenibacillus sp. JCM 10914 TaxID=1236974 RepID=UPI0003CC31FB|nr:sigma-70 family RNA polymerase sigma factor [Paenibacillus sp. JCM 10914]GAE06971.1 RNA polymerase sigma factor [Paenibacillus sp. JCM 10914]
MDINDREFAPIEEFRSELTAYCYRMLGSIFEADDAVQDTLLRAWQSWDKFRQESSRRHWMYRIATNVCLDRLRTAKRRALSMNLSEPASLIVEPSDTLPHSAWIWPAPDIFSANPAEWVVQKNTIRLAFIAILQTLPPRQRAVFIMRDVFSWSAQEIGDAMGMTATAVNSALQRARAIMHRTNLQSDTLRDTDSTIDSELLDRYVEAFEKYDIEALLALFHEKASLSMPPFAMWVRERDNLASFYEATRSHCFGSKLLPIKVSGQSPAYAQYFPAGAEGDLKPWGIHVLEIQGGKIAHIHTFIDSALYSRFGLPSHLKK